jgi:PhnB protein
MSVATTTHLNFRGQAREALEFYRSVFGGEIALVTYQDAHSVKDPAEADQIMWGQVQAPSGFRVMAYDVPGALAYDQGERPFFLSARATDVEELTAYWKGLAEGATVLQDLGPSGWAPAYGMLKDRFGVTWVLDIAVGYPAS